MKSKICDIRLVAVDMDGTLLDRQGKVSLENKQALQRLKTQGKEFVVCTGRSYEDARRPIEEAGLKCDFICMNGAMTCTYEGKVITSYELQREKVSKLLELLEAEGTVIDMMTDWGSFTTTSPLKFKEALKKEILLPTHESDFDIGRFHFTTREKFMMEPRKVYKMSAIHESEYLLQRVKTAILCRGKFNIAASAPTNIEITCCEAQKGKALLAYAKSKQIKMCKIMAIGDSGNDVSMLSLELGATVAMGDGMEEAKKAAGYITASNADHGVARAIYELALT